MRSGVIADKENNVVMKFYHSVRCDMTRLRCWKYIEAGVGTELKNNKAVQFFCVFDSRNVLCTGSA